MTTTTTLPKPPIVAPDHLVSQELEKQLAQASQDRTRLTAEHAELSFQVVTGGSQERQKVEALAKQIAELDSQMAMLSAARSVARRRDQERLAQVRLEGQKARVERVKRMLDRRTAYGAELTQQLEAMARTFRLLSENSERAGIASGVNPKAGKLSDAAIRELVANEIYRLMPGSITRLGPSDYGRFPGAEPASPDVRLQPYATKPLAERLAEADRYTMRELTRMIAENALPPTATAALDAQDGPDPIAAPEGSPAPATVPVSGETGRPLEPFSLAATVAANPTPTTTRHTAARAVRGH